MLRGGGGWRRGAAMFSADFSQGRRGLQGSYPCLMEWWALSTYPRVGDKSRLAIHAVLGGRHKVLNPG